MNRNLTREGRSKLYEALWCNIHYVDFVILKKTISISMRVSRTREALSERGSLWVTFGAQGGVAVRIEKPGRKGFAKLHRRSWNAQVKIYNG